MVSGGRQELGDVVEQAAEARRVAAVLFVQAGAAPVEEGDGEARLGQAPAGVLVPAAVTLDAVDADDVRTRLGGRVVAAVLPAVAVARGVRQDERLTQGSAPCAR